MQSYMAHDYRRLAGDLARPRRRDTKSVCSNAEFQIKTSDPCRALFCLQLSLCSDVTRSYLSYPCQIIDPQLLKEGWLPGCLHFQCNCINDTTNKQLHTYVVCVASKQYRALQVSCSVPMRQRLYHLVSISENSPLGASLSPWSHSTHRDCVQDHIEAWRVSFWDSTVIVYRTTLRHGGSASGEV